MDYNPRKKKRRSLPPPDPVVTKPDDVASSRAALTAAMSRIRSFARERAADRADGRAAAFEEIDRWLKDVTSDRQRTGTRVVFPLGDELWANLARAGVSTDRLAELQRCFSDWYAATISPEPKLPEASQ